MVKSWGSQKLHVDFAVQGGAGVLLAAGASLVPLTPCVILCFQCQ